jgi:hypothetical protein
VREGQHRRDCGKNDQYEKEKLDGVTRPVALGKAVAQESKGSQAR